MSGEIVEITVLPDGRVEMQVKGIAGMDCMAETEDLVRLLGGEVEVQQPTAEAYLDVEQQQEDRLWH